MSDASRNHLRGGRAPGQLRATPGNPGHPGAPGAPLRRLPQTRLPAHNPCPVNALWNELAARAAVPLDERRHALLGRYLDLLLAANATMNLTRITDRAAAEVQHVGDALTLLPFL